MKVLCITALAAAETVQAVVRASGAEQEASASAVSLARAAEEHVRTDQVQDQGVQLNFVCNTAKCCEAIQGVTPLKLGMRVACGIVRNCEYKAAKGDDPAGCKGTGHGDHMELHGEKIETTPCVKYKSGVPFGPDTDTCCRKLEADWNADASCNAVEGCKWKPKDKTCRGQMSLDELPNELRDDPEVGPAPPARKSGSATDVPVPNVDVVPTRKSSSKTNVDVPTRKSGSGHADAQTKPDVRPDGGKKPTVDAETLPPAHESDSSTGTSQEAAPVPDPYELLRKLQQQKRSEDPSQLFKAQDNDGWQRKMIAEQLDRAAKHAHGEKYEPVLEEVRARDLDAHPLTPVSSDSGDSGLALLGMCSGTDRRCGHQAGKLQPMSQADCFGCEPEWSPGMEEAISAGLESPSCDCSWMSLQALHEADQMSAVEAHLRKQNERTSGAVSEPLPEAAQCQRDAFYLRAGLLPGRPNVCIAATPEFFAKIQALGWSSKASEEEKADLVDRAFEAGGAALVAPDACCPVSECTRADDEGPFTYDDEGKCRRDVNGNNVGDLFAHKECCECSADTVYHWDGNPADDSTRCKTDVNMNGTPDRFADDLCCAPAALLAPEVEAEPEPEPCTHTGYAFQGTTTSSGVCVASEACTALSPELVQIAEACAGDLVCCVRQEDQQYHKNPRQTMVFTNGNGGLYKGKPLI